MDAKATDAVQHKELDAEVKSTETRARRRKFSASEKQRILLEATACKHGELGMLLRREGIYSATLAAWRKQQSRAITATRGRTPKTSTNELERENKRLLDQLNQAKAIIDIQKKLCLMLGLTPADWSCPQKQDSLGS